MTVPDEGPWDDGGIGDSDVYERRFALFVMLSGVVCSTTVLLLATLGNVAPGILPAAALAMAASCVGMLIYAAGHWRAGLRTMMFLTAAAVAPAAVLEPSGESALTAALTWLLMGVFASLLLRRGELIAMGGACTLSTAAVVAWIQALDSAPTLQPGGGLAVLFVGLGFVALDQIATYFRESLGRVRKAEHAA